MNSPMLHQRSRKEKTQWALVHCKKRIPKTYFFFVRKYMAAPLTWSSDLEEKCWETLPSKIVSLLHNSRNEGAFHNRRRSRVRRKQKRIWFMSILPPSSPSHPRPVPLPNTSLQCQAQFSWPFFMAGYHAVSRNIHLPNSAERDTTYRLGVTGAGVRQLGQKWVSAQTAFSYRSVRLLPGHVGPACNVHSLMSWSWLAVWFNKITQTGNSVSHTGACQKVLLWGAITTALSTATR